MDCPDGVEEVPWTSMSNRINASSIAPLAVVACRRLLSPSTTFLWSLCSPESWPIGDRSSGMLHPVIDVCGKHDLATTAICCCSVACGISSSFEGSMCSVEPAPFLLHLSFPDNAPIGMAPLHYTACHFKAQGVHTSRECKINLTRVGSAKGDILLFARE
jgi:hypothetical protein